MGREVFWSEHLLQTWHRGCAQIGYRRIVAPTAMVMYAAWGRRARYAASGGNGRSARLWVPGDWNALLRAVHQRPAQRHRADRAVARRGQAARGHRLRPHPAGARHRAADRQPLLRLPRLAPRQARGAQRRHGDALRPERAAHVHRRVPDHAADLPADQRSDPGLAGGSGLGVHHRRDRAARRVRRPDHPQVHAARGDARHAGRHLDRVHLDAAELPDVGGALDRVRRARDHPDQLDGERAPAVRPAGRPRGGDRRHGPGLDRRPARLARLHGADRGRPVAEPVRPAPADLLGRRDRRASATSGRCSRPRSRSASTTSPRR